MRDLEPAVHAALRDGLLAVGNVAKEKAVEDFVAWGPDDPTHQATAEGFKVRVRAGGLVQVEQSLRTTTGQHPEYGALMMTKGLLPARDETHDEATQILELHVVAPLHAAGF